MEKHEPFGAKWSMFCRLKVHSYVLAVNVAGTLKDVADYIVINRSTYIHYEEVGRDYYPQEHMKKLAELFEVPLENLIDEYNRFFFFADRAS